jgi:hypothetical protein
MGSQLKLANGLTERFFSWEYRLYACAVSIKVRQSDIRGCFDTNVD